MARESGIGAEGHAVAHVLRILNLKFLLGAMEQDSQILPVDAELPADLISIAFIEENCFQQGAVSFRKAKENGANFFLELPGENDVDDVSTRCSGLRRACFIERLAAACGAVMLEENVVAHVVNERPQAFRSAQTLIPAQDIKDPRECFLANIVNGVGRLKA